VRDFPQRARKKLDLASLFKVCPQCLGDLVYRADFSGDYYLCLQCNVRTEPRSRIGRLPTLPTAPDLAQMIAAGSEPLPASDAAVSKVLPS
jgi:hypothetical protein